MYIHECPQLASVAYSMTFPKYNFVHISTFQLVCNNSSSGKFFYKRTGTFRHSDLKKLSSALTLFSIVFLMFLLISGLLVELEK